jgi:hypothetical protein
MATIPVGTKFLGVDPELTNLIEKKGNPVDKKTEYFSIEDIAAAASTSASQGVKMIQVSISQAEALSVSGFSKLLVAPVTGSILIPVSVSVYRKAGGTAYTIANSIRLTSVIGSSSSTVGSSTLDAAFTSATQSTSSVLYSFSSATTILPGNALYLVSGSYNAPSALTAGTGDLVALITYAEVDTTI